MRRFELVGSGREWVGVGGSGWEWAVTWWEVKSCECCLGYARVAVCCNGLQCVAVCCSPGHARGLSPCIHLSLQASVYLSLTLSLPRSFALSLCLSLSLSLFSCMRRLSHDRRTLVQRVCVCVCVCVCLRLVFKGYLCPQNIP